MEFLFEPHIALSFLAAAVLLTLALGPDNLLRYAVADLAESLGADVG